MAWLCIPKITIHTECDYCRGIVLDLMRVGRNLSVFCFLALPCGLCASRPKPVYPQPKLNFAVVRFQIAVRWSNAVSSINAGVYLELDVGKAVSAARVIFGYPGEDISLVMSTTASSNRLSLPAVSSLHTGMLSHVHNPILAPSLRSCGLQAVILQGTRVARKLSVVLYLHAWSFFCRRTLLCPGVFYCQVKLAAVGVSENAYAVCRRGEVDSGVGSRRCCSFEGKPSEWSIHLGGHPGAARGPDPWVLQPHPQIRRGASATGALTLG